ncbi:MAG: M14-type cytosolic carboxypeptidase [Gammaproteobacteria bacterium]|nr:M14-type cytosolic carboxypeptidase [Gammaproteobacteria bacterium]
MVSRFLVIALIALVSFAASADDRYCENGLIAVDARHAGGDLDGCRFKSGDSVELTFRPEDRSVDNDFSWFSFRVTAKKPQKIKIRMRFPDGYARFWPKISHDGKSWTPAAEAAVRRNWSKKSMTLIVTAGESATWVSAQELLTQSYYDQWLEELAAHQDILTAEIGKSVEGRPVTLVKTSNKREAIVLLGRQHPTEVPGALAMRVFVDALLADTVLAKEFRERFTLLIVPLVNPDGVENGHSRHNAGGTDLNRDWGPFTQPETQSIAGLLEAVDKLKMTPRLMLDFHATKYTDSLLFYTQLTEDETDPPNFATNWLYSVRSRLPDFAFVHDPRPTSEQPNTKGYFYTRYGIPSFTYELGDEADRESIRASTPIFAEEMMRVMLQADLPGT